MKSVGELFESSKNWARSILPTGLQSFWGWMVPFSKSFVELSHLKAALSVICTCRELQEQRSCVVFFCSPCWHGRGCCNHICECGQEMMEFKNWRVPAATLAKWSVGKWRWTQGDMAVPTVPKRKLVNLVSLDAIQLHLSLQSLLRNQNVWYVFHQGMFREK